MKNNPLSGFDKITWEEFCGILEMLQLYKSLSEEKKEIIDLLMLGMQKRNEEKKPSIDPAVGIPDDAFQKGDIVKFIKDDEWFGDFGKIYEKVPDSSRKDLYIVIHNVTCQQRLYAGCSLQFISRGSQRVGDSYAKNV
jgi:hypothetical protein